MSEPIPQLKPAPYPLDRHDDADNLIEESDDIDKRMDILTTRLAKLEAEFDELKKTVEGHLANP